MDIRLYPDAVLRKVARPVTRFDEALRRLSDEMIRTLTLAKGYGLAAPQVGVLQRLIVLDVEDYFAVVVNPEIFWKSEEIVLGIEGCLSLPGVEAEVPRARSLRLRGADLEGRTFELEAEDLLARVIQHEVDHLNGVLFIDHLGQAKRLQVLKEYERARKQTCEKGKQQAKAVS